MAVKDSEMFKKYKEQENLYQREINCQKYLDILAHNDTETSECQNYVDGMQEELKNENDQEKIQYLKDQIEISIRYIKSLEDETRKAQIEIDKIYKMYPIN
jgi:hypothetical protein